MVTRAQKEKAYSEAMKLIADAIGDRSQELVLADLKIQAIPKLEKPSSAIKRLYVDECPVLTDIAAIQDFVSLEEVHLRKCDALTDLQVLAKLPKLKVLHIGACEKIVDLGFLAKCHKLLCLELNSMEALRDISDVKVLTWLEELKIGFLDIEDFSALAQLKNAKSIEIHSIDDLKNLNFLKNLRGLRSLAVNYCDALTNVSSIKYLEGLEVLELSANDSLTKIEDVKYLKKLKSLDISSLDIDSCEFLSALESLEFLYMSGISGCNPTFSLSPIANLPKLRELDINYTSFQDVSILSQAPSLEFLHCKSDTPFPMETFLSSRENWPALKKLDVEYAEGVPEEIMQPKSKGFKSRVDRLKAWREDILSSGTVEDDKIKVFVLGNGSVGKTQLSRRLKGLPFDPSIQSTEGAELGHFPLLSSSESSNSMVEAQLWDFGGQDIYLSTHGLFLDSRAIYIVAWNPDYENALPAKGEHGVPVYNRPLVYWLDYIETLVGINARIIVLQTQCDTEELREESRIPFKYRRRKNITSTACSAKTPYGMERLWAELRIAAFFATKDRRYILPRNWTQVIADLDTIEASGRKFIDESMLNKLLAKHQAQVSQKVFLDYLCQTGRVFWREDLFNQKIILDQSWALEGIYAVLNRAENVGEIVARGGYCNFDHLASCVWKGKYTAEEQSLLLTMMTESAVCFDLGSGHYIIPPLLPSKTQVQTLCTKLLDEESYKPEVAFLLEYDFLHDGLIRSAIGHIGKWAGRQAVYWDSGLIYSRTSQGVKQVIRVQAIKPEGIAASSGVVRIEATGEKFYELAEDIAFSLSCDFGFSNESSVTYFMRTGHEAKKSGALKRFKKSDQIRFASLDATLTGDTIVRGMGRVVYVSYSRKDYASHDSLKNLIDWLEGAKFRVRIDNAEMQPGDSIDNFMSKIGSANKIVLALSENYFKSLYCMTELYRIWQHSENDYVKMRSRIAPFFLDSSCFSNRTDFLNKITKHWAQYQMSDETARGLGAPGIREKYITDEIKGWIGQALNFLLDLVMPSPEEASHDELYHNIGKMLMQQPVKK